MPVASSAVKVEERERGRGGGQSWTYPAAKPWAGIRNTLAAVLKNRQSWCGKADSWRESQLSQFLHEYIDAKHTVSLVFTIKDILVDVETLVGAQDPHNTAHVGCRCLLSRAG